MSSITRCPHCDTSFRVTHEQLAAADGAVRCGACLGVFSASEHLVAEVAVPRSETEVADDAVELPREGEADDTMTGESAFVEDVEEASRVRKDGSEPRDSRESERLDDSFAPEGEAHYDEPRPGSEEPVPGAEASRLDDIPLEEFASETHEREIPIETPEELIGGYQAPVRRHYVAWTTVTLLSALVLASQVAWFNRNILAQNPVWRGYYESVCGVLGCNLPVYSDLSALHVAHLAVRSHPSVAHALAVDAIVRNDAPWRQYFPSLALRFSDIRGHLVASRTFKPAEYLAGEMTGVKFIPAKTEVRISLEIVDPGRDATNYSLTVVR